jgi:hypothetical protein
MCLVISVSAWSWCEYICLERGPSQGVTMSACGWYPHMLLTNIPFKAQIQHSVTSISTLHDFNFTMYRYPSVTSIWTQWVQFQQMLKFTVFLITECKYHNIAFLSFSLRSPSFNYKIGLKLKKIFTDQKCLLRFLLCGTQYDLNWRRRETETISNT